MNAVTVPSDTSVRARLERESQERGGPKEGAASGVRRIKRHPRVPNQVWRTTITVDVPAGSADGPTQGAGLSVSRLAQNPARSGLIEKISP